MNCEADGGAICVAATSGLELAVPKLMTGEAVALVTAVGALDPAGAPAPRPKLKPPPGAEAAAAGSAGLGTAAPPKVKEAVLDVSAVEDVETEAASAVAAPKLKAGLVTSVLFAESVLLIAESPDLPAVPKLNAGGAAVVAAVVAAASLLVP